jgi:hypothetical protein
LFGQGASGAGGTATYIAPQNGTAGGGGGGSGGGNGGAGGISPYCCCGSTAYSGVPGTGGAYGGGSNLTLCSSGGAVRIVYPGNTRTFPSTCVGAP